MVGLTIQLLLTFLFLDKNEKNNLPKRIQTTGATGTASGNDNADFAIVNVLIVR